MNVWANEQLNAWGGEWMNGWVSKQLRDQVTLPFFLTPDGNWPNHCLASKFCCFFLLAFSRIYPSRFCSFCLWVVFVIQDPAWFYCYLRSVHQVVWVDSSFSVVLLISFVFQYESPNHTGAILQHDSWSTLNKHSLSIFCPKFPELSTGVLAQWRWGPWIGLQHWK